MRAPDGVDFTPLWQSLVDSAAEEVPAIMKALGLLIAAVIAMGVRHFAFVAAVKREAVAAERAIGGGHGSQKHERVKRNIKETWPMSRMKTIDATISGRGKAAAHKDRDHRKSLIPGPPEDPPPAPPSN